MFVVPTSFLGDNDAAWLRVVLVKEGGAKDARQGWENPSTASNDLAAMGSSSSSNQWRILLSRCVFPQVLVVLVKDVCGRAKLSESEEAEERGVPLVF